MEGGTESILFFFFQMPNVKYAIALSGYYMSLILTYLLAKKKIEYNISALRCFRKKLTDPSLHSLMTLPLLNYVREPGKM